MKPLPPTALPTPRPARAGLFASIAAPLLLAAACLGVAALPATASAQVDADLRMMEASGPFRASAERFVERAAAGDLAGTQALLSHALQQRVGDAAVRQALQGQIVPFFARGGARTGGTTITRTTDAAGQQGFAFYMWWQATGEATPRPFSVYTVLENGQPVVANVVPDRLVPGRHP
jgi:hypothetical protein